jgi:hypothetical protein
MRDFFPPFGACSTRRGFIRFALAAAALRPSLALARSPATSLDLAYEFLDEMMDRYFTGRALRLVQSFVPTKALRIGDIGYTYDNALVAIALLQRANGDDIARANVLGASLLYGQAHDPYADGRVRDGYHVDPFVKKDGSPNIAMSDGDGGSDCGNMAWTGLALAHLYAKTGQASYRSAALALGTWIQNNAYDMRGAGGFTGGITQRQHRIAYKATEHNIDLYAFFSMLASLSGDPVWTERATHALTFVQAMWNARGGFFWTGTGNDGVTINKTFIPEDVQTWSYLAIGDAAYAASLDWAYANLYVNAQPFVGVSFSNADISGVWFEGTAHLAAAFQARGAAGDGSKAAAFLRSVQLAQTKAQNHDGKGIVAASKDGLRTGDGDKYYAALHIGATSWYCIAAQAGNPLRP